jgi:hypothetical protein
MQVDFIDYFLISDYFAYFCLFVQIKKRYHKDFWMHVIILYNAITVFCSFNTIIIMIYYRFQENENKIQIVEKYFQFNEKRENND